MAQLFPSALPTLKQHGGLYRELDVLEQLRLSLPDNYDIYHSVALLTIETNADRFGEIDILVMDPDGKILLMEVKAGTVTLRDGNIFKMYSDKEHDIGRQCRIQHGAMSARLKQANLHTSVTVCLVIPDYALQDGHVISMPRERIIDAERFNQLGTCVREILASGTGCNAVPALRALLRNEFRVTTNLTVMRDQIQSTSRQLSDGLATWVPRISSASGNIRIQATAGSGKTQLALKLLEDAVIQHRSIAYVCYNRPLADHLRTVAPAHATVTNFHELCVEHYRRHHAEPDFNQAGIFDLVTTAYIQDSEHSAGHYDVLIIDEGQDFEKAWLESLCMHLKPEGQLYLMEDDDQRLYDKDKLDLEDAVQIRCHDNYRSPGLICAVINALGLTSVPINSKNPYQGALPGFHIYQSENELLDKTAQAVKGLVAQGFALSDIVVLTDRGRNKSALLAGDKIGPYTTSHFTGAYDAQAEQVWSQGDLLVDSVFRYKGQSAPAVVLSEVDFAELNDKERRKLFVGLTRGQMAVEIVLSVRAEQILSALINHH